MAINIPYDVQAQLAAYVDDKQPPGNFLREVLENDLAGAVRACRYGDNEVPFVSIVSYCIEKIPALTWGSPEAVNAHLHGACATDYETAIDVKLSVRDKASAQLATVDADFEAMEKRPAGGGAVIIIAGLVGLFAGYILAVWWLGVWQ